MRKMNAVRDYGTTGPLVQFTVYTATLPGYRQYRTTDVTSLRGTPSLVAQRCGVALLIITETDVSLCLDDDDVS